MAIFHRKSVKFQLSAARALCTGNLWDFMGRKRLNDGELREVEKVFEYTLGILLKEYEIRARGDYVNWIKILLRQFNDDRKKDSETNSRLDYYNGPLVPQELAVRRNNAKTK